MKYLTRIAFAIAFGATLWGVFDLMLWSQGTAEPELVTLEQVGRLDGTTNIHLAISEFQIGKGAFHETGKNGETVRTWLPLLTGKGDWTPRPVVGWVSGKIDDAQLEQLASRPVLTGMVTNSIQWVGANQRARLNETYPAQDFNNALAFNIDRAFPSVMSVMLTLGVGILALVVSIVLLIIEIRSASRPQTPAIPETSS